MTNCLHLKTPTLKLSKAQENVRTQKLQGSNLNLKRNNLTCQTSIFYQVNCKNLIRKSFAQTQ